MDRHSFHEANWIYQRIKIEEEKERKILGLKDQIIEILEGYYEIPEEEVFDTFHKIENLSKYVGKRIEKAYKQIDEL